MLEAFSSRTATSRARGAYLLHDRWRGPARSSWRTDRRLTLSIVPLAFNSDHLCISSRDWYARRFNRLANLPTMRAPEFVLCTQESEPRQIGLRNGAFYAALRWKGGSGSQGCSDFSAPLCVFPWHCCSRFPQRARLLGNAPPASPWRVRMPPSSNRESPPHRCW
jgi:hypothetical protein